jgi:ABC-type branched-subunit amino acid transport system substrate-binding protein
MLALVGLATAVAVAAGPTAGPDAPLRLGLLESGRVAGDSVARGAAAAVAEVNADGGIDGRLVELLRLRAPEPWRDGAMLTARLAFEGDVVALIGPVDPDGAHVAAQIATKRRIPVVTLTSDESLTRVKDPWVFSGVRDDGAQARALLRRAFDEPRGRTAVIVVPPGRAGRRHAAALERACRSLDVRVLATHDDSRWTGRGPAADALLLWSEPEPALAVLRSIAAAPSPPRILGSARLDDPAFMAAVPRSLPFVAVASLAERDAGKLAMEALGYDVTRAVASAARRRGVEPAALRDGLLEGDAIVFDESGRRSGPVSVALITDTRGQP